MGGDYRQEQGFPALALRGFVRAPFVRQSDQERGLVSTDVAALEIVL